PAMEADHFISLFSILRKVVDLPVLEGRDVWGTMLKATERGKFGSMLDLLPMTAQPEDYDALFEIHKRWGEAIEKGAQRFPSPPLPYVARKAKLRVGIVSGDLRQHVVSLFIMPIFKFYDRDKYEL